MRAQRFASLALGLAISLALLPSGADARNPSANAAQPKSGDAHALAMLVAVDQHEVSLARQALAKGVAGGVRDFATKMQADHAKNLADTRRVARENKAPATPDADVKAMQAQARSDEQKLGKLSGEAYSKAYVEAMVKGHAEVLGKLDTVLIPGAKDPEVAAHLKATREAVAMHLSMAQKLQ